MFLPRESYRRRSIRLPHYDYSQAGVYCITACAHERACLFGEVVDGVMVMNEVGDIVADEWIKTSQLRDDISLDAWVVMPNHFHGILVIHGGGAMTFACKAKCGGTATCRGTARRAPTGNAVVYADDAVVHADGVRQFGRPIAGTLPTIIGAFKAAVTKRVNRLHQSTGTSVWQRNYYERVVRDEAELMRLREYIHNNPARWARDSLRVDL